MAKEVKPEIKPPSLVFCYWDDYTVWTEDKVKQKKKVK